VRSEAGPTYWDDNYVSLLPGESRTLKAVLPKAELEGKEPTMWVLGWNVRWLSLPLFGLVPPGVNLLSVCCTPFCLS
jgi:hypothetical protein